MLDVNQESIVSNHDMRANDKIEETEKEDERKRRSN